MSFSIRLPTFKRKNTIKHSSSMMNLTYDSTIFRFDNHYGCIQRLVWSPKPPQNYVTEGLAPTIVLLCTRLLKVLLGRVYRG